MSLSSLDPCELHRQAPCLWYYGVLDYLIDFYDRRGFDWSARLRKFSDPGDSPHACGDTIIYAVTCRG